MIRRNKNRADTAIKTPFVRAVNYAPLSERIQYVIEIDPQVTMTYIQISHWHSAFHVAWPHRNERWILDDRLWLRKAFWPWTWSSKVQVDRPSGDANRGDVAEKRERGQPGVHAAQRRNGFWSHSTKVKRPSGERTSRLVYGRHWTSDLHTRTGLCSWSHREPATWSIFA